MKALILYFSGTGNTKYVAEKFERELKFNHVKTEIYSIEEKIPIQPDTYDLLILGCPKYYECPVLHFVHYLKKNCRSAKKKFPFWRFARRRGRCKPILME